MKRIIGIVLLFALCFMNTPAYALKNWLVAPEQETQSIGLPIEEFGTRMAYRCLSLRISFDVADLKLLLSDDETATFVVDGLTIIVENDGDLMPVREVSIPLGAESVDMESGMMLVAMIAALEYEIPLNGSSEEMDSAIEQANVIFNQALDALESDIGSLFTEEGVACYEGALYSYSWVFVSDELIMRARVRE